MSSRFTLADVRGICVERFHERELVAEQARRADRESEAQRSRGVRWSGLADAPATEGRPPDQIRADAEAAHARALAFLDSPRGRFLASLSAVEALGFRRESQAARAAYARGFADPDRAACPAEIGYALAAVARLEAPAARDACRALAQILSAALNLAAA
jgi:hypothetical protein